MDGEPRTRVSQPFSACPGLFRPRKLTGRRNRRDTEDRTKVSRCGFFRVIPGSSSSPESKMIRMMPDATERPNTATASVAVAPEDWPLRARPRPRLSRVVPGVFGFACTAGRRAPGRFPAVLQPDTWFGSRILRRVVLWIETCLPARGDANREYFTHARLIQPTIRLRSFPPGAPRCSSLAEHLLCRFSRSRAGPGTDCAARMARHVACQTCDGAWGSVCVGSEPSRGGAGRCYVSAGGSGGCRAAGRGDGGSRVEANGPSDDEIASLVANL